MPFILADASTLGATDSIPPPPVPAIVAERTAADSPYPLDAIGLTVSWVSGSGLMYRHFFDDIGIQVSGVPYVTGDVAFLNFGGQVMYRVIKRYPFQFSPMIGVGYAFNKNTFLSGPEKADMGIAPGVQLDYAFNRNLWAFAHIGYTFGAQVTSSMTADFKPGGGIGTYFAF